jgi:hypothetical protein
MARTSACPRCGQPLQPLADLSGKLRCTGCGVRCSVRSTAAEEAAPAASGWGDRLLLIVASLAGAVLLAGAGWFLYRAAAARPVSSPNVEVTPGPAPVRPVTPIEAPPSPRVEPPRFGDAKALQPEDAHPAAAKSATAKPQFFSRYKSNEPVVNQAIDRGVVYLKARLGEMLDRRDAPAGGYRVGAMALAGLTLLECGVPSDDPLIEKTAAAVRGADLSGSYDVAVSVWFLARLGTEGNRIRELALRLIAAQTANGGWTYTCPPLSPKGQSELLERLRAAGATKVEASMPALRHKPGDKLTLVGEVNDDNSITQFVVLALWIARDYEVPVERSLALVEARFRACQNADGSWGYFPANPYDTRHKSRPDSMTCSGLLGLAVGRGARKHDGKPGEAVRDPVIDKAVAFLGKRLGKAAPMSDADRQRLQEERATGKARLDEWLALVEKLQLIEEKLSQIARPALKRQRDFDKLPRDKQLALAKETNEFLKKTNATLVKLDKEHNDLIRRASTILPLDRGTPGRVAGVIAWGDLYYLWSLERMAVVYDWKTIAGVDWYAWGSGLLLAAQNDDGSWTDTFPGVPDTCFALLFLKRVNVARSLTSELKEQGPIVIDDKGSGP